MTQTLYLTMAGGISDEEAYSVQSDKDLSELRCVLRGYRYEDNDTALLRAAKPDGTVCYLSGIPDGDNAFRFVLTEQISVIPGDIPCDVCIYRGAGAVSSDRFTLKVRDPAAAGAMTESESDYIGFPELIRNTVNAEEITDTEINTIWEEVEA